MSSRHNTPRRIPHRQPSGTPSRRGNSRRAVPPETDRRGYCRQYSGHKNTVMSDRAIINDGCAGCPGLEFGEESWPTLT